MENFNNKSEQAKQPKRDLVGQKFNMLTVESFSHYSKNNRPYWNCRCDCGKVKAIYEYNFQSGNTKSCGCLKVLRGKTLQKDSVTCYDGTQIEMQAAKITKRNNTSGFRGIYWVENIGKWRVSLMFRGTRHHLGYYSDFDKAVDARLKGEEMVDEFICDYYDNVAPSEVAALAKVAFDQQIHAKEKSEAEFKSVICKKEAYGYISPKTTISGNITTDEHLLVSGTVIGDIHCTNRIMINGTVTGNVTAEVVYIPNGKVVGDIQAKDIFCSNISEQIIGTITGNAIPYTRIIAMDIL